MARLETVVSPTSPGAGRFRDWVWPEPGGLDGNPTSFVGNRLGTSLVGTNPVASTIGFSGGTTTVAATWKGIDCAQIVSTAGAGEGYRFDNMMVTHIKTTLNFLVDATDDEQCFRVFCNMASQNVPNAGTDYGWVMTTPNTNGRILADTAVGFGFNIQDGNVVNFLVRGGLGLVTTALTAAPFDTTQFHCYELRITSATAIVPAGLVVLIDNVAVAGLPASITSWGGATALPPSVLNGGRAGFRPGIYNTSGVANALFVQKLRYCSAPQMAATL